MEDLVEHIAGGIDINKGAAIKPDLTQCNISHDLHCFLEFKGDTWQERKGLLQDPLKKFKQQEELHNRGETQNITDVRATLQSQQDVMDV